ncbi:metallophosphoesterase [[Brevibacterium] frigoritolerans]|nr:metallophosphoesterase [Peribacillus frigoritolerans]
MKKKRELIIIAGDLSDFADQTIKMIETIEKQVGVKVLFIPGNHDIWAGSNESSWDSYDLLANHPSTLIDQPFSINDEYVIVGDMGWYDYSFAPETISPDVTASRKKTLWRDGKYAKWNMKDPDLMGLMMEKIQRQLEESKGKKVIFVTHFIPYKDFIIYKSSNVDWNLCNGFMGSANLGWLIDQYPNIDYLIFGHTHKRYGVIDQYRNKTVICNPIGYVGEWETEDFKTELENVVTFIEL